jgi:hypothetical protein
MARLHNVLQNAFDLNVSLVEFIAAFILQIETINNAAFAA